MPWLLYCLGRCSPLSIRRVGCSAVLVDILEDREVLLLQGIDAHGAFVIQLIACPLYRYFHVLSQLKGGWQGIINLYPLQRKST
jgi:hypothetical protein